MGNTPEAVTTAKETPTTSKRVILNVYDIDGERVPQKQVILRAGELAQPGYYGTINVSEENLAQFTETMKTRTEVTLKPGPLRILAAKLRGTNVVPKTRTFEDIWSPRRLAVPNCKSYVRPDQVDELMTQAAKFKEEHPKFFNHP